MSFRAGPVSYSRHRVFGETPKAADGALLDRLADSASAAGAAAAAAQADASAREKAREAAPAGRPRPSGIRAPEVSACWSAGRHVLDDEFTHEACGFGSSLLAGVRFDVNCVPAALRRAYVAMAEAKMAAGTETGFLSRAERRAAREEAEQRCEEELIDGRHRRSTLLPLLWDLGGDVILAPIDGDQRRALFRELVSASLGLRVTSRSAGSIAWDLLAERGLANDLDDLRPSIVTAAPEGRMEEGDRRVGAHPSVPWASSGPEPKDFLGNEFLLWLWWVTETAEGLVDVALGAGRRTVAVAIDRVLDMECAWGVTGRVSLRGDAPTRLPEAAKALQHGKWPRRCGLILAVDGRQWQLTLHGDRFSVAGATLPEIDEARSVREIVEQRIERTLELDGVLMGVFETFLSLRMSSEWPVRREQLAEWIARRAASRAAA